MAVQDAVCFTLPLSDLSASCAKKIGSMLSSDAGSNFLDLAGLLGYTIADVTDIERSHPTNPGLALLQKWSQQANSTVAVLRERLQEMNRHDIIRVLDEELRDLVQLSVTIKDQSESKVIFEGIVQAFGSKPLGDALRRVRSTPMPISRLSLLSEHKYGNAMDLPAAEFTDRQLTFIYNDQHDHTARIKRRTSEELNPGSSSFGSQDPVQLMVVVKNASNSKIQRYFTVDTFGSRTLKEALQSKSELDIPLSSLGLESDDFYRNWAERKVSEFKGQQLNLIYTDGPSAMACYHPEAVCDDEIDAIMSPYIHVDGAYILRPSRRDNSATCLSLIQNRQIIHYKLWQDTTTGEYYVYDDQRHTSIENLIKHYEHNPLSCDKNSEGQRLTLPID